MTHIDHTPPGRACWIDLGSPDPAAAASFYSGLFGWKVIDLGPEAGDYRMCEIDGRAVAGLGPQQNTDAPPYWATYFGVESVEQTLSKVENAGGAVFMPAMDVMEHGRMALAADPTGAVFSVWQPLEHKGVGVHSVLGTLCWSELLTRDTARAAQFYKDVFGWEAEYMAEMNYTIFKLAGEQVGGMMAIGADMPADMPANWAVYFYTEDIAGTVAGATTLGATVIMPPTPIEGVGQFALVADPHGAVFNLLQPA